MSKIEQLEQAVHALYDKKDPNREGWADWLAANHVFVVADNATKIAELFGADPDLARASALLHDIADVKMSRFAEDHEEQSLAMGRQLMQEIGYTPEEIANVVDDAVKFHGCHNGESPTHPEGKALAAADAMAHFLTDYYVYTTWTFGGRKTLAEVKEWTLKKIERDFNDKIQLDAIRDMCRTDYERLKDLYSR